MARRANGWWIGRVSVIAWSMAALVLGIGCSATPEGASLTQLNQRDYDEYFDATLDALRDSRFRLDRVDRRLGVITTQPRTSASIVEPWRGDNTTVAQAWESTIQHQRRIVRVEFLPMTASPDDPLPPAGAQQVTPGVDPFEPAESGGPLLMDVRVFIERAHRPGRQVETASLRRSSYYEDPLLEERGLKGQFWEPIARDPHLEAKLRRRINEARAARAQLMASNDSSD
ncbi:MAG: hypothetical protein ACF8PN_12720 [Phycisphaerales bacterium]